MCSPGTLPKIRRILVRFQLISVGPTDGGDAKLEVQIEKVYFLTVTLRSVLTARRAGRLVLPGICTGPKKTLTLLNPWMAGVKYHNLQLLDYISSLNYE